MAGYDAKLKEERKRADDQVTLNEYYSLLIILITKHQNISLQALYYAGVFLLYVERIDKAKEYVDRLLKINPQSKDGLILKGWVEVFHLRESRNKNALQYFEAVLKTNSRNIEALFGKAKYFEMCGHFDEANKVCRFFLS